jgi:hypothetical protein
VPCVQVDCKNVRPRLDAIEAAAAALEAESHDPTTATETAAGTVAASASAAAGTTTSTAAGVVQGMAKGEVDEAFQQVNQQYCTIFEVSLCWKAACA